MTEIQYNKQNFIIYLSAKYNINSAQKQIWAIRLIRQPKSLPYLFIILTTMLFKDLKTGLSKLILCLIVVKETSFSCNPAQKSFLSRNKTRTREYKEVVNSSCKSRSYSIIIRNKE